MARLLVSVRDEREACAAASAGAAIIDVKDPSAGPLGMASHATWCRVRAALPASVIVSVALGELIDWTADRPRSIPESAWRGIAFRKIGLAGAGLAWRARWGELRGSLHAAVVGEESPAWVAVAYLDWKAAGAPEPFSVVEEAGAIAECRGILFDTWDKGRRTATDPSWGRWIGRAKGAGRFVAIAGSLDADAMRRLLPLGPDIFAVRGAACLGGDRQAPIDPARVARLAEVAAGD